MGDMKRKYFTYLQEWLFSANRKPLVVRGARQVGKTWLIRQFCQLQGKQLVELNFEKQPQMASLFESNDPKRILVDLGAALNQKIEPDECLLFLDEIQAVPKLFSTLRWFAEDLPKLPVIAAGSLLEFILEKHSFSMPVGRITYMHMEPMSFEEFLLASDKARLFDYLHTFEWKNNIPAVVHQQLMDLFKEYLVIGGMPAVVASWITEHSLIKVSQIQHDLLATYRDDFNKYHGRIDTQRLNEVFIAVPELLGEKFVCANVNSEVQARTIKQSLELLCKARVCHAVRACEGNGVPLAARINKHFLKAIFLDVGLCSAALGFTMDQIAKADEIVFINKGGLAEQVAGQLLRTVELPFIKPELFYWHREGKGAAAEIDYIIQHGSEVVPVEVKAGSTGSLKSLHLFMSQKKLLKAFRINSDFPSQTFVQVKDQLGDDVKYTLNSLPFYLIGQFHRLMTSNSLSPNQ